MSDSKDFCANFMCLLHAEVGSKYCCNCEPVAAPLPAAPAPTEQAEPSVAEMRKYMNSLKLRIAELEDDLIVTEQSNERLRAALAARQAPTEAPQGAHVLPNVPQGLSDQSRTTAEG